MELASQECCLHSVMFIRRYVTFVLVLSRCIHIVWCCVRKKSRTTIFKSILEQLTKNLNVQPSEWKLDNILPYTIKTLVRLDEYFVRYFDFCLTGLMAFRNSSADVRIKRTDRLLEC